MDKNDLEALRIDRGSESSGARRRRWPWALVVVVVLGAGVGVAGWQVLRAQPVTVETIAVAHSAAAGPVSRINGGGASVLNASGYVVALLASTVSSQITGQIQEVIVNEGERVNKGQILARLDDRTQQAAVAMAVSQVQTDEANVAKARAQLNQDLLTLKRTQTMAAQHLTSAADLDQADSQVAIDRASLAAAEGQARVDRDALDSAKILLSYTIIRAPFAGVVTEKYAHPGEMISPAAVGGYTKTGICRLVDMGSLEIDVDVNENYIQRVRDGMRAEAVLDAYPGWRIPAHVISIVPTANRDKATVKVRIAFDKLDPRILPDMSAQVWFYAVPQAAETAGNVGEETGDDPAVAATFTVPKGAVRGHGTSSYVFTVVASRAHKQPITVGGSRNDQVTVLGGLAVGDIVITHADKPLADGVPVKLKTGG
ncbi:MAG: efflux RND transporter periplasmic adaptor subunit [Gammaproteobacteria bacterium]